MYLLISQELVHKNPFLVWLRNRLISGGLELVLSHTEKACYHRNTDNHPRILK